MDEFKNIHELLIFGKSLPRKYNDHTLSGNWKGYRECHMTPDWLLIYKLDKKNKEIFYARMGSHAELLNI